MPSERPGATTTTTVFQTEDEPHRPRPRPAYRGAPSTRTVEEPPRPAANARECGASSERTELGLGLEGSCLKERREVRERELYRSDGLHL